MCCRMPYLVSTVLVERLPVSRSERNLISNSMPLCATSVGSFLCISSSHVYLTLCGIPGLCQQRCSYCY